MFKAITLAIFLQEKTLSLLSEWTDQLTRIFACKDELNKTQKNLYFQEK